jgi:hypothetical protein
MLLLPDLFLTAPISQYVFACGRPVLTVGGIHRKEFQEHLIRLQEQMWSGQTLCCRVALAVKGRHMHSDT